MKKLILYSILIFSAFAFVQIPDIIKAIKSGSARDVSNYFDNTVEITLPGKSTSVNREQAESMLQNFFRDNPVKDFKILHQSKNQTAEYCIGTLATGNGLFRTTIYTKEKNGQNVIQELRFEK